MGKGDLNVTESSISNTLIDVKHGGNGDTTGFAVGLVGGFINKANINLSSFTGTALIDADFQLILVGGVIGKLLELSQMNVLKVDFTLNTGIAAQVIAGGLVG